MNVATDLLIRFTCLSFIAFVGILSPAEAQVQKPSSPVNPASETKPTTGDKTNTLSPTGQGNNILSIAAGDRLVKEANQAISSQNYALAAQKLQEARQVYNQLSSFYQELNSSFTGIDISVSDSQRQKALATAQKRDEASYQLALVYRARNQPELAIPLLVQIIKSQNPTRELGTKAYQQLFELGFVDAPYSPANKK
ncbi:hypothetical protein H6G25_10475 [Dolichospermum sp. FACHB-1091]|uniref:hypothetical protein n=1 Tax=Dolichospermum sp. FACHB-1091 TaxID=2692798 RepID=UPI00167FF95A|nr:hypothetical protein [Dolichospermum sp. FACHB-1091]MBD2443607.1 hypothetical protein [Dolichospermum sp. FACHB-1091]